MFRPRPRMQCCRGGELGAGAPVRNKRTFPFQVTQAQVSTLPRGVRGRVALQVYKMWSAPFFRSGREGVSEDVAAHIQHEICCQCLDTDQSRLTPALSAQQLSVPMAPHLTLSELDFVHDQEKKGKTPIQIHAMLMRKRDTAGRQVNGWPTGRAGGGLCISPRFCRDP